MEFKDFARRPDAYQEICRLIAPSIFGHDDVKKAVACLLFSGSRKVCSSPTCWHCNLKLWWRTFSTLLWTHGTTRWVERLFHSVKFSLYLWSSFGIGWAEATWWCTAKRRYQRPPSWRPFHCKITGAYFRLKFRCTQDVCTMVCLSFWQIAIYLPSPTICSQWSQWGVMAAHHHYSWWALLSLFVNVTSKVVTKIFFVLLVLIWLKWQTGYLQSVVEFSLQSNWDNLSVDSSLFCHIVFMQHSFWSLLRRLHPLLFTPLERVHLLLD